MKNKAFMRYICCIRSMHMRRSLYEEMMQRLDEPDPVDFAAPTKQVPDRRGRFPRIAAVSICFVVCAAAGLFAFYVHEYGQISDHSALTAANTDTAVTLPIASVTVPASSASFPQTTVVSAADTTINSTASESSAAVSETAVSETTAATEVAAAHTTASAPPTQPYTPVSLSAYFSFYFSRGQSPNFTDSEVIVDDFYKYAAQQQKYLRNLQDSAGKSNSFFSFDEYCMAVCSQTGLLKNLQDPSLTAEENDAPLLSVRYQYTADRRLYVLLANLGDETFALNCDRASLKFGQNADDSSKYADLQFRVPDYPYSWLQPYLGGTVTSFEGEDYTVRIAPHRVFELCAVLPDALEIDPIITPRLRFTDNNGILLFDDYIAINWQAPDLARTEENDLLIAAKAAADVELLPQLMEFQEKNK